MVASYTLSKRDKNNKVLNSIKITSESDMEIISAAYYGTMVKSSTIQIDITKISEFYNVEVTYTNNETSNAIFCYENGNACMIVGKEEGTSGSLLMAMPVKDELYKQMIGLLNP